MYDAGCKGRYRNQLGLPLHEATDGFEEGILTAQVYILTGVGFYLPQGFPLPPIMGHVEMVLVDMIKASWLVQHGISLRGLKEIQCDATPWHTWARTTLSRVRPPVAYAHMIGEPS